MIAKKPVEWEAVDANELRLRGRIGRMNRTRNCLEDFIKSGREACKLDPGAYSSLESLRRCFGNEIRAHYKDKVSLIQRDKEFYLLRRDI